MADAAPQVATERELKLSAWPEFTLPDLSGVISGVRADATAETSLAAAYFDTVDLRLLRRGVTVRFRRGERGGDIWTVKLPEVATLGLERREISVAGTPGAMPRLLRDLTRGWTFGEPLERMATIRTSRRTIRILAADDRPIAVIDDDDVRGLRGRRVAARFRELEIELAPDAPSEALRSLDRALRKASALPAPQVPKLARTLGAAAGEPWDLAPPQLGSRPTAAELFRRRLMGALAVAVDQHAAFVLDDDRAAAALAEGIAQLRGDLRLFRPLLDMPDSADVESGLEQVSQDLSALCDQDAAMSTLRADAANARLGDAAHAVIDAIAHERAGCHEHAARLLRSARYGTLLGRLRQLALVPPVRPKAKRRAARTVPGVASSSVRALREQIRRTTPTSPTTSVRLTEPAQDLRHAVELAAQFAGKPADRATRDVRQLVELLDHLRRDRATVERLSALATASDTRVAWSAGVLAGIALQRAAQTADRVATAARRIDRRSDWAWLP